MKLITVYCGSAACGAVIAKEVVPDVAAAQAKALVPQVMHCPDFETGHPNYPDVHTRVEITEYVAPSPTPLPPPPPMPPPIATTTTTTPTLAPGEGALAGTTRPKKKRAVEKGELARTLPTTPPPPNPEGATLGMSHTAPSGEPESRVYDSDEIPQGEVPAEGEIVDVDPDEPGEGLWSGTSDGSEPETPGT